MTAGAGGWPAAHRATLLPLLVCTALGAPLAASAAPSASASGWHYTTTTDAMRGTTTRVACLRSVTVIRQGFPYHAQRLELCVEGNMVTFRLPEGGQLTTEDLTSIKLDDGPVVAYNTAHAPGSPMLLMMSRGRFPQNGVDDGVELADKIAAAKRVMVEVEVYTGGIQQATFNVSGLHP